jgi:flagellar assembly protein FliH
MMSSSSERAVRGTVLRGEAATRAVQAALVELANMPAGPYETGRHGAPGAAEAAIDPVAEQGYRDGFDAGLADARQQEAARIDDLRVAAAAMARAADALVAAQAAALAGIEQRVPEIAFELTQLRLGRGLELAQNPGRDAVVRALALAPDSAAVTVRLNLVDAELVGDLGDVAGGRPLHIVADPQVGPGDCIAEADATRIDATLAGALDRVRQALIP